MKAIDAEIALHPISPIGYIHRGNAQLLEGDFKSLCKEVRRPSLADRVSACLRKVRSNRVTKTTTHGVAFPMSPVQCGRWQFPFSGVGQE
jgi:hypothetical protein